MFFLYLFLIIFILIIVLLFFTSIKINIYNLRFTTEKIEGRHLNKDYKIQLSLYIFDRIKYLNLDITKAKIESEKIKANLNKVQKKVLNNENNVDINVLEVLRSLNIKLRKIKLDINIGTEDAALSAKIVGVLSGIISIIIGCLSKKSIQNEWKVMPVYQNRNFLNIYLDCIFDLKLIHIINTIYILKKKGENHGRTSNRRAYAYSNE